jgi:hypothetical protein
VAEKMTNTEIADIQQLRLPQKMRKELKQPLGELITEEPTMELLRRIENERPPLVILIGDFCVQEALAKGFIPDISIIDGLNLREPFPEVTIPNAKIINANNPPANITIDAWINLKKSIQLQQKTLAQKKTERPILLLITGEEDLLVLPAVIEAPLRSYVVYGQPHEGIVLIKVTINTKNKCKKLIERMKVESNENKCCN